MSRSATIRLALLGLAMACSAGCDDRPSRTPPAAPIDYGDPGPTTDGEPISTSPAARRIETH